MQFILAKNNKRTRKYLNDALGHTDRLFIRAERS
jgi:hypothetical protein